MKEKMMAGGKEKSGREKKGVVYVGCVRRVALKYIRRNCSFSFRAAGGATLALSSIKEVVSLCAGANAGIWQNILEAAPLK